MEFDNYVKNEKENKERNKKFFEVFEADLKEKGLSPKTIRRHVSNAELFLNGYLYPYEELKMEDGPGSVGMFLSYYFIRKCLWSTPASLKSTGASIKKFYKSMRDHGYIEKEAYEDLVYHMKESMDDWCEECAEYNETGSFSWY